MHITKTTLAISLLAAGTWSCADTEETPPRGVDLAPLDLPTGCNPLMAGFDCLLPYPSDFFRAPDPSNPSGSAIVIPDQAKIRTQDGSSADITDTVPMDGYSRVPTILALMSQDTSADNLVALMDPPDLSLAPNTSPTLIIEADTGNTIAHFADLDPKTRNQKRQAIVLHPIVQLQERARYIVVFTGLESPTGDLLNAPEGFRRLRDGQAQSDPQLAMLASHYDDNIFPIVANAGVQRSDIQLAWDFTTGSDEHVTADMLRVRELTLAALDSVAPVVTIDDVEEATGTGLWRVITGTVTGPMFLDGESAWAKLSRDSSGLVEQSGVVSFPFVAKVPESVRDNPTPGRVIEYGHGFFSSRSEIGSRVTYAPLKVAVELGAVLVAIDWWGMSEADEAAVGAALLTSPNNGLLFVDRVHQAMANWMTMTSAISDVLPGVSAFRRQDDSVFLDPNQIYFWGVSQGHILGGTLAALEPRVERYSFSVGAAGLVHLMIRSTNFSRFLQLVETSIGDPLEVQKYLAQLQRGFDRIDPATYGRYVLAEPLPGSPANRRVIMHAGLGDTSVPNLGQFLHARILGLSQTTPTASPVWGLSELATPADGSALTVFDFGVDLSFQNDAQTPISTQVHGATIGLDEIRLQLDQFFQPDGVVTHPCVGACDLGGS